MTKNDSVLRRLANEKDAPSDDVPKVKICKKTPSMKDEKD